ncbi:GYP7 [Candida oxycetoniae]|uniref:Oxidant-induced cell-cycle arrest protein 5 n=1 Tax=Candida oxycetoniae TaxID=497107 RepID=A0AAI9T0H1_9ASCO|nr:GYP7 [Candida oxycetoniae]KAI3406598.2 GYP7 [Candida oxycetoniae]
MSKRSLGMDEVSLIFVKSKVYLHPTPSKENNVVGYLSLSKERNSTNLDIKLSFTPESVLSQDERQIYNKVDTDFLDLKPRSRIVSKTSFILSSYAFTTTLGFIYSIQFRKPSPGYYYGSIIINTQDGVKLPIIFFHDDESPSTINNQKLHNKDFNPFQDGNMYWGAIDFLEALKKLVNVRKSTEPSVYLINPGSDDLRNFAPFKLKNNELKEGEKEEEEEEGEGNGSSVFDFSKLIATAKWRVLETVATFAAKGKNNVMDLIEDNAPTPIKQIIKQPEIVRLGDDFNLQLAKWAQQVKRDAEKSSPHLLQYERLNKELGDELTLEEVSKATRRDKVSLVEWNTFFDSNGMLIITSQEVMERIRHGGLEPDARPEAWLFLLGVYPWDSSSEDREVLKQSYITRYHELKLKWVNDDEKRSTNYWRDQKFRIEKDIMRTDRDLEIFKQYEPDDDNEEVVIKNHHLRLLMDILLTYNEYNTDLGYVQGMTDLLSPLYVTLESEEMSFWAFTGFMKIMDKNFEESMDGMKKQLLQLTKLVALLLPEIKKHLDKCESDLFFMFRMLLVWFKREFDWEQTCNLWEVFWCSESQPQLFFALAIISANESGLKQLTKMEEVLKYFNDLSGRHSDLQSLLVRAEFLFIKFKRMMSITGEQDQDLRDLL